MVRPSMHAGYVGEDYGWKYAFGFLHGLWLKICVQFSSRAVGLIRVVSTFDGLVFSGSDSVSLFLWFFRRVSYFLLRVTLANTELFFQAKKSIWHMGFASIILLCLSHSISTSRSLACENGETILIGSARLFWASSQFLILMRSQLFALSLRILAVPCLLFHRHFTIAGEALEAPFWGDRGLSWAWPSVDIEFLQLHGFSISLGPPSALVYGEKAGEILVLHKGFWVHSALIAAVASRQRMFAFASRLPGPACFLSTYCRRVNRGLKNGE
jgi:hypothetical protein